MRFCDILANKTVLSQINQSWVKSVSPKSNQSVLGEINQFWVKLVSPEIHQAVLGQIGQSQIKSGSSPESNQSVLSQINKSCVKSGGPKSNQAIQGQINSPVSNQAVLSQNRSVLNQISQSWGKSGSMGYKYVVWYLMASHTHLHTRNGWLDRHVWMRPISGTPLGGQKGWPLATAWGNYYLCGIMMVNFVKCMKLLPYI